MSQEQQEQEKRTAGEEKLRAASYATVDALKPGADGYVGPAPYWHGWALREAFFQGAQYALEQVLGKPLSSLKESKAT